MARISADTFLATLADLDDLVPAEVAAQAILRAFNAPFPLSDGREVTVTASIGLTVAPGDDDRPAMLVQNAEIAMQRVKEAGRNGHRFFTPAMNAQAMARFDMETRLRHALARGELFLNFQPMLGARSDELEGVETLLRWRNPDLGLVGPDRFISLAEATGLIVPIGEWVLRAACRQAKAWHQEIGRPLYVAVNVSPVQIRKGDFLATVARALEDSGLAPECLELEITEGLLLDDGEAIVSTLHALSGMGVRLSIDDFGTGYSALRYLKQFSVNTLKIDRSFIRDLTRDTEDDALVTAIIAMAHGLGLSVVAEGVETAEQLAFLRHRGCDIIQGFFYSRPLAEEDFRAFARRAQECGDRFRERAV